MRGLDGGCAAIPMVASATSGVTSAPPLAYRVARDLPHRSQGGSIGWREKGCRVASRMGRRWPASPISLRAATPKPSIFIFYFLK
jgi:hypothetical protein